MIQSMAETATQQDVRICRRGPDDIAKFIPAWEEFLAKRPASPVGNHPRWLRVLQHGLKHVPYCIEATRDDQIVGLLPLAFVRSALFGRFLVSLPYLNSTGVLADDDDAATSLIDGAVELADELDVRYLELRGEKSREHSALSHEMATKVHMRLELPASADDLWSSFKPKVRNQVRKGEKHDLAVEWGSVELLDDYYAIFARNMRDLGTPVFGRSLFKQTLTEFSGAAELCIVRADRRPIAAAILIHGPQMTEVPSASSLREFNSTNANMLMYWHLLQRACERGQSCFDFGRSTVDSNTFRFKKQWGAKPVPAIWQYYIRHGSMADMRPDSGRNQLLSRLWRKLPLPLANRLGPPIVRGIP
jgi:FemAB-related protein (PEP-CTERM system-associated)